MSKGRLEFLNIHVYDEKWLISKVNSVTGNTLFQSKVSVNVLQMEIYVLKQIKKHHCICEHATHKYFK